LRIKELSHWSIRIDANGNRVSVDRIGQLTDLPKEVQAAYNAANEMTQFNTDTLTYDANGNLMNDGVTTDSWDARNRLTSISGPSVSAGFVYDALGRRISKTINGTITEYLYDGNDIVAEIQGGVVTTTYLRGLNIDEPFVRTSSTGQEFYHTDALGSVLALTDQTGTVQTHYAYDPFGNTTVTGTSTNPFQYTGRENDGTGLYYYRARYYGPGLQRFISNDPLDLSEIILLKQKVLEGETTIEDEDLLLLYSRVLANPELQHSYLYAVNNPLTYTDPTGELVPQLIGCGIGAGVSIGFDLLGGRKISLLGAGIGCALGALGGSGWASGIEFKLGKNFRLAPFGNRTGHPYGKLPHYHRRITDANGQTIPGGGIKWHRPWEKGW